MSMSSRCDVASRCQQPHRIPVLLCMFLMTFQHFNLDKDDGGDSDSDNDLQSDDLNIARRLDLTQRGSDR